MPPARTISLMASMWCSWPFRGWSEALGVRAQGDPVAVPLDVVDAVREEVYWGGTVLVEAAWNRTSRPESPHLTHEDCYSIPVDRLLKALISLARSCLSFSLRRVPKALTFLARS
jgi:hypothetical protein